MSLWFNLAESSSMEIKWWFDLRVGLRSLIHQTWTTAMHMPLSVPTWTSCANRASTTEWSSRTWCESSSLCSSQGPGANAPPAPLEVPRQNGTSDDAVEDLTQDETSDTTANARRIPRHLESRGGHGGWQIHLMPMQKVKTSFPCVSHVVRDHELEVRKL